MTRSASGRAGRGLLAAVRFYQRAISPALPPRCRFTPTCSAYAVEAIELHGAAHGSWLALRRILKCAPWHPGGVDFVPPPPGTPDRVGASNTGTTAPRTETDPPTPTPQGPQRAASEETSVV